MDRRDFLKYSSLISAAGFVPEMAFSANGRSPEKIVVLVELKGGNDGFNTLVPYMDDAYKKLRPNLSANGVNPDIPTSSQNKTLKTVGYSLSEIC